MKLSARSRLSLWQILATFRDEEKEALFLKYGIHLEMPNAFEPRRQLEQFLQVADSAISNVLDELARTHRAIKESAASKRVFDERWNDLLLCVQLDGYHIPDISKGQYERQERQFVPIETVIEGQQLPEDDLIWALRNSQLTQRDDILKLLNDSADNFRSRDFNGCLANARVALETLAREIAAQRAKNFPGSYDPSKWGQLLAYLRTSEFIKPKQEEGLSGVYSFISDSAHTPVGITEEEYVRLGRNLAVSMCYFLIKLYSAPSGK